MKRDVGVLILDIDGIVHGKDHIGHCVSEPDHVIVFPEVVHNIKAWREHGGRVVGVSNQADIALGYMTEDICRATMQRIDELYDNLFDSILCSHGLSDGRLIPSCWWRKPMPGLAIRAINELRRNYPGEEYPLSMCLMVGDEEDKDCAISLGVNFMWSDFWRKRGIDDYTFQRLGL